MTRGGASCPLRNPTNAWLGFFRNTGRSMTLVDVVKKYISAMSSRQAVATCRSLESRCSDSRFLRDGGLSPLRSNFILIKVS